MMLLRSVMIVSHFESALFDNKADKTPSNTNTISIIKICHTQSPITRRALVTLWAANMPWALLMMMRRSTQLLTEHDRAWYFTTDSYRSVMKLWYTGRSKALTTGYDSRLSAEAKSAYWKYTSQKLSHVYLLTQWTPILGLLPSEFC